MSRWLLPVTVMMCVGCSAKSGFDVCDLTATPCGQIWQCGEHQYSFSIESVQSVLAPEPFFHYTCKPGLEGQTGEPYEEWYEYAAGRSYEDLCGDVMNGSMSKQLRRVNEFCEWPVATDERTSCRAPATPTGRYMLKALVSRSNRSNVMGISVLLKLPDDKLSCGPHLHVFDEEVEQGCVWRLRLRYDATTEGLVHASVFATNTCQYPDWWSLYLDAELLPR